MTLVSWSGVTREQQVCEVRGRSLAARRCKMDERVQWEPVDTPEGYERWIVRLCLDMAFTHTQVPYEVIGAVRELAERHGIEAGIEAAHVVLRAFEAGRCGESRERDA